MAAAGMGGHAGQRAALTCSTGRSAACRACSRASAGRQAPGRKCDRGQHRSQLLLQRCCSPGPAPACSSQTRDRASRSRRAGRAPAEDTTRAARVQGRLHVQKRANTRLVQRQCVSVAAPRCNNTLARSERCTRSGMQATPPPYVQGMPSSQHFRLGHVPAKDAVAFAQSRVRCNDGKVCPRNAQGGAAVELVRAPAPVLPPIRRAA